MHHLPSRNYKEKGRQFTHAYRMWSGLRRLFLVGARIRTLLFGGPKMRIVTVVTVLAFSLGLCLLCVSAKKGETKKGPLVTDKVSS